MKLRWVLPALACCLLLAGCSRQAEIRELEFALAEEQAFTLSDGTTVDLWRKDGWEDGNYYYRLSDGTDLLRVKLPVGPENVHNTYENVEDLNETARAAVLAWFEDRGLLYDTERELERAYGWYLACQENREEYADRFVQQIIYPAGSNEAIICFVTEVTLPLEEPQMVEMITLQTVFDRETGQVISGWDLFTIPEAEVRAWVAEHAAGDDPVLRREMEAALGRKCLEELRGEVVRLALLCDRELDGRAMKSLAGKLSHRELEELRRSYARRAEERLPLRTQLCYERKNAGLAEENRAFLG